MRHLVSVLVQDHPGVLQRVAGLLARRGFNIESLAVGRTHQEGLSRISLVVSGDDAVLEQVEKQLNRLIEVIKVTDHAEPHVERELALVKVNIAGMEERMEVKDIAEAFRARIVDVAKRSIIFELTGDSTKVSNFIEALRPYGLLEVMRTGAVGMSRGEQVLKVREKKAV
ncbi:MAG: acetolactate synthase small subunit [Meiothermus sp.]|uniref:acetolactate synthase small subunit n=1 Tax=Meiothermus sp. TaxID=1955249 RepID=UPI0025CEECB1|nr:acetolactate synthase small subunit [Meiothermus sp.]MCS7059113.1 acetolactate synthase small subunit [Meiothermus sp.]MCS7195515.1 acetolactate synthase small subunit [Meiothermus sp.]MCX7741586.1 acetolactate synthase small subunit [Meiothermus sp.]MDW8090443.1 acetolactate synthase small subunit [Meiothermus sp.]MDW8481056.1 acetolactate synthase small subunit [Meiothermus sp.]